MCVCVGMSVCGEVVSKHVWTEVMKLEGQGRLGGEIIEACVPTESQISQESNSIENTSSAVSII